MIYFQTGSANSSLQSVDLESGMFAAFDQLGHKERVLIIPPDFTRFHSKAGELTQIAYKYFGDSVKAILPALGTHSAMTSEELSIMFKGVPENLFRIHDWRNDVVTVGHVPSEFVSEATNGMIDFSWPAQVNKLLLEGNFDLILSLGQVVPHEVIGMANYDKNIFVGTGGSEGINKSHFIGAVFGMERMMGRADTPVRKILNYASDNFTNHLPIVYAQTVIARDTDGLLKTRGLYVGDTVDVFQLAAKLSLEVNFLMLDKPLKKVVVYLEPSEFKSTWLGNKSIYRTRMAIENGGELIVLAPALREFGEDKAIDGLIRKYGYVGTKKVLNAVQTNDDLKNNLSAAAHLIHGSTEGRFSVTYCPGHLTQQEIESVNFKYAPLASMLEKYNPEKLKDGFNTMPDGEEIFYIANPAIGLWAYKERFSN